MILTDYRDYTDSLSGGVWTIYNTNPQTAQYTPAKCKTTVVVYRKPAPTLRPAVPPIVPELRWMARCLARR
jgi:hypothetical protein